MDIDWIEPQALAANGLPVTRDDFQSLHGQGIRAIISLTEHPLTALTRLTRQDFAALSLTLFHAPVVDHHAPDVPTVWQVVAWIDHSKAEGKPVYLHCHAGIGRTGTLLHAYYLSKGYSLEKAQALVKKRRRMSQFSLLTESQQTFLEQFATHLKPPNP